jgi:hypothetical protein
MTGMGLRRDRRRTVSKQRGIGPRPVLVGLLLVLAMTIVATAASWVGPAPARADTDTNAQKVALFEDAIVGVDQVWDNVVVVGGDLLVEGTVKNVVVVVGGNVTLTSTARVGTDGGRRDTALVSVFGDVTMERGARVTGETVDVGVWGDTTAGAVSDPFLLPYRLLLFIKKRETNLRREPIPRKGGLNRVLLCEALGFIYG